MQQAAILGCAAFPSQDHVLDVDSVAETLPADPFMASFFAGMNFPSRLSDKAEAICCMNILVLLVHCARAALSKVDWGGAAVYISVPGLALAGNRASPPAFGLLPGLPSLTHFPSLGRSH